MKDHIKGDKQMNIPSPFTAIDTDFNRSVEFALKLKSVAGTATLIYGPNFPGDGVATGLANDATEYTATIKVDGVDKTISIVGSAAQTFADLIDELNTDLGGDATATLLGNSIIITSATTGASSLVAITDVDLFSSIKGSTFALADIQYDKGADEYVLWDKLDGGTQSNIEYVIDSFLSTSTANTNTSWSSGSDAIVFPTDSPTGSTQTGLDLDTVYQLNLTVDGGTPVELLIGLDLYGTQKPLTFNHLLQAINQALVAQAVPAVASYDATELLSLRITSNSVGASSSVVIADGAANGLLAALVAFGPTEVVATAGYQIVNVGGNKVVGAATGLAADASATSGYQIVNVGGDKVDGTATGLADDVPATSGYQYITSDAAVAASDAAITTNGTYYFKVDIDGAGVTEYSVTTAASTSFTELAALMDAEVTAGATVTFDDANDRFVVTSKSTGASSTIAVTAGSTGTDVFAQVITDSAPTAMTIGTAVDGEDAVVTTYTASVSVDGGANAISIDGSAAQTFGDLIIELNADLSGAVASLDGGNIKITSDSTGASSVIAITDTDLFAALAGYSEIETAVDGEDVVVTTYTASVLVDGVANPISIDGSAAQTFGDLITELDADLSGATASLDGGNLKITSDSTGATSTIAITDTDLFAALAGFVSIGTAVAGVDSASAAVAGVNGTTDVSFPVVKDGNLWDDWSEVLVSWSSLLGTGYGPLFTSGNAAHLRKENKPASKGKAVNTYVYWDGSAWKFFDSDDTVGSTVNPPELS